jgi:hypothetical protein
VASETKTPDPVAAALQEVRENITHLVVLDVEARSHSAVDECAGDTARLLAALEAVLGNHAPLSDGGPTDGAWCPTCWRIWPCETYKAIARELLGEDGT